MNTIKKIIATGAVAIGCLSAFAGGSLVSLGTTNSVNSGNTNITGWPTNSFTTNGLGVGVGHAVDISYAKEFTFICQGTLQAAATNVISVTLVTAQTGSSPGVGSPTDPNGTNRNDFATTGQSFAFATPVSTNTWFNFQTNFSSTSLQGCSTFVGISAITNGFTSTNQLVNSNGNSCFFISRKIIPVALSAP